MYDSPEAATYRTNIEGWVSSDGIYCGVGQSGEQLARYRGSTHRKCEQCGAIIPARSYTICEGCRRTKQMEKYNALPFKEYDGSPVVLAFSDRYFFSEQDIQDFIEEAEDDDEDMPDHIDLLFCEENNYRQVDCDYWEDEAPEDWDGEFPKEMQEALDKLNEVISRMPAQSYQPGKIRTRYEVEKEVKP